MAADDSERPRPEPGDRVGARRMRWSFRLCVMTVLGFTTALWISDRYLRYDLAESQYIMSLTHYPESARAILRQVVKRDAETHEFPTPKYMAALAEREEADRVLPTYEKAYKLEPGDPALALRYGCRLFQAGRYGEARERFREASAGLWPTAPGAMPTASNPLPEYLEAVTLAPWDEKQDGERRSPPQDDAFGESLGLIAKTNATLPASGKTEGARAPRIVFPAPLWSDTLPRRGVWYSRLRRQNVDECCAPLYKYADFVFAQARHQIALRQATYWGPWLEAIQGMGERLAFAEDSGTIQATAGIRMQLAALELGDQLASDAPDASEHAKTTGEKAAALLKALRIVDDFEATRDDRIAADRARFLMPLRLCWQSVAALSAAFAFAYLLSRVLRVKRQAWSVPHPRWGKRTMAAGLLLWTLCLFRVSGVAFRLPGLSASMANAAAWAVLLAMILFGLAYPAMTLSASGKALDRKGYRIAYAALMRRYYGILLGAVPCIAALWAMLYRAAFALYPWQIELLVSGLEQEEIQVVRQALSLLQ